MPMTDTPSEIPAVVVDDIVSPALAFDLGQEAYFRARVDVVLGDRSELVRGSRRPLPPPRLAPLPGR
jgi:hypothetical protein